MLSRVLEPEVMDSADEAREYDSMDHAEVNRNFVADFLFAATEAGLAIDAAEASSGGRWIDVIDLGAGTAQIPIELCRRAPGVRVVAVDLSVEMLNLARYNVELAGVRDRIQLAHADAKQLQFADGAFAAVISNSIVHHIPEPRPALVEAVRLLQPGGVIFIRDLMRPASDEQVQQLVDQYAAGATEHQRALFNASLRAALTLPEIQEIVASLGFSAETARATSDRHWTWTAQR